MDEGATPSDHGRGLTGWEGRPRSSWVTTDHAERTTDRLRRRQIEWPTGLAQISRPGDELPTY